MFFFSIRLSVCRSLFSLSSLSVSLSHTLYLFSCYHSILSSLSFTVFCFSSCLLLFRIHIRTLCKCRCVYMYIFFSRILYVLSVPLLLLFSKNRRAKDADRRSKNSKTIGGNENLDQCDIFILSIFLSSSSFSSFS